MKEKAAATCLEGRSEEGKSKGGWLLKYSSGSFQTRDQNRLGLNSVLGISPGEGHSNPLQYSSLENPYGQRSLAGCSP